MKPKETLTGHVGPVWSLARGNELLFSSSSDMTVKVDFLLSSLNSF